MAEKDDCMVIKGSVKYKAFFRLHVSLR